MPLARVNDIELNYRLEGDGEVGQITTPTLVLAGEEDVLIPVSLSRRIHEAIPASEWATTKGGHACVWEHPAEFNRTFLDFVRRHGRG
jgi:3-oxoadipate enol-lactonase